MWQVDHEVVFTWLLWAGRRGGKDQDVRSGGRFLLSDALTMGVKLSWRLLVIECLGRRYFGGRLEKTLGCKFRGASPLLDQMLLKCL